jgi:hypothetical protein
MEMVTVIKPRSGSGVTCIDCQVVKRQLGDHAYLANIRRRASFQGSEREAIDELAGKEHRIVGAQHLMRRQSELY